LRQGDLSDGGGKVGAGLVKSNPNCLAITDNGGVCKIRGKSLN